MESNSSWSRVYFQIWVNVLVHVSLCAYVHACMRVICTDVYMVCRVCICMSLCVHSMHRENCQDVPLSLSLATIV